MLRLILQASLIWLIAVSRISVAQQIDIPQDGKVESTNDKNESEKKTRETEIVEKIPITKPGEFLVNVPWTSESHLYQLKYASNNSTKEIHSKIPYFALPKDARIISLKVFRKNKTLFLEYPAKTVRNRLIELSELGQNAPISKKWLPYVQHPVNIDWVQKTTELRLISKLKSDSMEVIKPVAEADYEYYENAASRIEKNASQKINQENLESWKFQKSQFEVELAVGKCDISSELNTNLITGKSWQIMPRVRFTQALTKENQKYLLGIEYGDSAIKLSYLGEVVQSHFREIHIQGSTEINETWTIGLVFQSLQIPELSDFTTELDGTNYGKLKANSRNALALRTDFHVGSESQITLGWSPYLFKGGGYRTQLSGQLPLASMMSLNLFLGAGYDYINASRKYHCDECLPTNKTTLGQIYVSVNARQIF